MRDCLIPPAKTETDMANPQKDWRILIKDAVARAHEEKRLHKQDRSRQRRAEILVAALRIFAKEGIARARINDIAAEAGVPSASIYDYFDTKEELAYAVPIHQQTDFFAEFEQRSRSLVTSRECLTEFLVMTVDFARRNPEWARVLYLEVWPSVLIKEARVRHVLDDYGRIVVRLLIEGGERGEWPVQPDPYQTATILIGSLNQLIITWLLYRNPRQLMRSAKLLIARLMRVLDITDAPAEKASPRRAPASRAAKSRGQVSLGAAS
jgi:AcrR family transcriptional regulator